MTENDQLARRLEGHSEADHSWRRRWVSRRALLLHLEVIVVVSGCAAAGWWQVTRALAGNGLSWFYSIEWPAFAVLAVGAWWHLLHEDPAHYRARRQLPDRGAQAARGAQKAVVPEGHGPDRPTRVASTLVLLVIADSVLGVMTMLSVPFGRPSGWHALRPTPISVLHAAVGLLLGAAVIAFWLSAGHATRITRLATRIGAIGITLAALGGLATVLRGTRLVGMLMMLLGGVVASFGFSLPLLERLDHKEATRTESLGSAD